MIEACPTCFAYAFSEIQATIEEYYTSIMTVADGFVSWPRIIKRKYTRVGMHVGLSLNILQIREKV